MRYVRRYPHRIPIAAVGVRRLVSHVRYRLPRIRCPAVVVAAAVLRRHHEHVARAQVSGADRTGARIAGPRPPERRAVRLAGFDFEIVCALRHVGEAGGARRVPAPQPRCHGPYRHLDHLRTARRYQLQERLELVGALDRQVAGGEVAAPHDRDLR